MKRVIPIIVTATVLCTAGCSKAPVTEATVPEIHLKHLAKLYGDFQIQNKGKVPKDEAEFKAFAAKQGMDSTIFVSPRDNEPYVVRYNDPSPTSSEQGAAVIAHEKTGSGGKKFVAFAAMQVKELADNEFTPIKPIKPR